MKKILLILGVLVGLCVIVVAGSMLMLPWMNRWGATSTEVSAAYTGDELIPAPAFTYTPRSQ